MFYHQREAADRGNKIGRLLELALADLKDSEAIQELSKALSDNDVDLGTQTRCPAYRGEINLKAKFILIPQT